MPEKVMSLGLCSFAHAGKKILDGISFELMAGEFVSILGPNGSGKTTLLKCINRILQKNSGNLEILGRDQSFYSQRELAKRIAYVPQTFEISTPLSVYEFVCMSRYPFLSNLAPLASQDKELIDRALEFTGSTKFSASSINNLSGGERQKVLIAAALAQNPRILLLDEPTTFLDPSYVVEISELLVKLKRQENMAILSVTHDINRAAILSDRVLALAQGKIFFEGTPAEFMKQDILKKVYGSEFTLVNHPSKNIAMVLPQ